MNKQADRSCEKCGSMYRNGDLCNKCGNYQPVPESFYESDSFSKIGKQCQGRQWDKKLHAYKHQKKAS